MKIKFGDFVVKFLLHKWRGLSMIGKGFEFFTALSLIFILQHFCTNFYSGNLITFPVKGYKDSDCTVVIAIMQ